MTAKKDSKPPAKPKAAQKPKPKKGSTSVDEAAGTATIHGDGDAVPCAKDESPTPTEE